MFAWCDVARCGGMLYIGTMIVFFVIRREFVLRLHDEDGLPMDGKCCRQHAHEHARTDTHVRTSTKANTHTHTHKQND